MELWKASDRLGGQLRESLAAPRYDDFADYLAWQERHLQRVGVRMCTGHRATPDEVVAFGADVVAIATGAKPRRPDVPSADGQQVLDIRAVLAGAEAGRRVVIVAQDDHMPPLMLADFLSERGHEVTIVYPTAGPAPLLGRYILGGILAAGCEGRRFPLHAGAGRGP